MGGEYQQNGRESGDRSSLIHGLLGSRFGKLPVFLLEWVDTLAVHVVSRKLQVGSTKLTLVKSTMDVQSLKNQTQVILVY